MRARLAIVMGAVLLSSAASAQEKETADTSTADNATIGQLVEAGYEIKAAVPNGKRFVLFLQKNSTAYACEMSGLSQSQCGKIN